MLRLATDEDVHEDIIRGLRRREPALDIVRVVDVGLGHTPDPLILEWAAGEGRVLITGDLNSMVGFAWVGPGEVGTAHAGGAGLEGKYWHRQGD
jgi:hypothetical protein